MQGERKDTAAELLAVQTPIDDYGFSYIDDLSLRCAVELGVPEAIHGHGRPITTPQLTAALSLAPAKASALRRLMRFLCHIGIFAATTEDGEDAYSLTPYSRLLLRDHPRSLFPFVFLGTDQLSLAAFSSLGAWFRDRAEAPTPFQLAHGKSFWELVRSNPRTDKLYSDAMTLDTAASMDDVINKFGYVFEGVTSLVDVGGHTGLTARAIVKAFPEIKCTVLDLPQVIDAVTERTAPVVFASGDMFEYIPRANAILLKWVLHNWGDEDCIKILERCKEAIPSKEEGGKVIVIDMVVDSKNANRELAKMQLSTDILMLAWFGGKEREEHEWRHIFTKAGFSDYKISPFTHDRAIIELYP